MAGNLDFRTRERIVLFAGGAAIALLGLAIVAGITGHSLGSAVGKVISLLVVFYLCARIAAHAKTLEERGASERLARFAWLASPIMFLVLAVETLHSAVPRVSVVDFRPSVDVTPWLRIEATTDVVLFALFLVTCMAVWIDQSNGVSASLTRISYAVVALFSLTLVVLIWGRLHVTLGIVRALASLFVLSVVGWLLVAILRRVERLDEEPPDGPAPPLPVAPVAPPGPQSLTPQP